MNNASEQSHPSKTRLIGFRVTDASYNRLKDDADRAGVSISDYLRSLSLNAPLPRKARLSPAAKINVGKFIGEMGRIGNNLNQLAHGANTAKSIGDYTLMPRAEDVISACDAVKKLLQEVRAELKNALK